MKNKIKNESKVTQFKKKFKESHIISIMAYARPLRVSTLTRLVAPGKTKLKVVCRRQIGLYISAFDSVFVGQSNTLIDVRSPGATATTVSVRSSIR